VIDGYLVFDRLRDGELSALLSLVDKGVLRAAAPDLSGGAFAAYAVATRAASDRVFAVADYQVAPPAMHLIATGGVRTGTPRPLYAQPKKAALALAVVSVRQDALADVLAETVHLRGVRGVTALARDLPSPAGTADGGGAHGPLGGGPLGGGPLDPGHGGGLGARAEDAGLLAFADDTDRILLEIGADDRDAATLTADAARRLPGVTGVLTLMTSPALGRGLTVPAHEEAATSS
jgi:hypothetical protein